MTSTVLYRQYDASAAAGTFNEKGAAPQRDPQWIHTMINTAPTPMGQPQLSFIREGMVNFTPAQANMVLKWCRYERQRDETKAKGHIATLAEDMRRGNWLPKSQLDFARLNSRLILVNGHHRMRAQVEAHADILWNIAIHDCASDGEVRSLYYRFDTNLRKRSAANIIGGIGLAEDTGLRKEIAAALWHSAQVIHDGMIFRRYSPSGSKRAMLADERVAVCRQYADEAKTMERLIALAPTHIRRKLKTISVFSVAMVTLKAEPATASEFWKGLAEDDGLTKGDPRKSLLVDMQSRTARNGLIAAPMMAAARAWNAYRAGKNVGHIKVTGHPVPIDGTGYVVRA